MEAARVLGLSMTVSNTVAADGEVLVDIRVYDDQFVVPERLIDLAWPRPLGWGTTRQIISDDDEDIFSDARWQLFGARAVWLRITDYSHDPEDNEEGIMMWVVEFSDASITRR